MKKVMVTSSNADEVKKGISDLKKSGFKISTEKTAGSIPPIMRENILQTFAGTFTGEIVIRKYRDAITRQDGTTVVGNIMGVFSLSDGSSVTSNITEELAENPLNFKGQVLPLVADRILKEGGDKDNPRDWTYFCMVSAEREFPAKADQIGLLPAGYRIAGKREAQTIEQPAPTTSIFG